MSHSRVATVLEYELPKLRLNALPGHPRPRSPQDASDLASVRSVVHCHAFALRDEAVRDSAVVAKNLGIEHKVAPGRETVDVFRRGFGLRHLLCGDAYALRRVRTMSNTGSRRVGSVLAREQQR